MKTDKNIWVLNVLRALAAAAVMTAHARNLFFVDYAEVADPTLIDQVLYFFTGFLRESVVIFFVISGFLVGGSVEKAIADGKFDFRKYFVNRTVRLALVLWPALALGFALDVTGILSLENEGRYGMNTGSGILSSYPDLYLTTLLGNAFFLQTILVPVLGTNTALWSLAYEFWYYLLYPVFRVGIDKKTFNRGLLLAGTVGLYFIGPQMAAYGMIWGLGILAKKYAERSKPRLSQKIIVTSLFFCWLFASRTGLLADIDLVYKDFGMGLVTALFIAHAMAFKPISQTNQKVWALLSGFSYSLYLIHLPFLFYMIEGIAPGERLEPTFENVSLFALVLVACYSFAFVLSRVTEAKTLQVRGWINRRLFPVPVAVEQKPVATSNKKAA